MSVAPPEGGAGVGVGVPAEAGGSIVAVGVGGTVLGVSVGVGVGVAAPEHAGKSRGTVTSANIKIDHFLLVIGFSLC